MAESTGRKRARAAVDKKTNPGGAKKAAARKKAAEPLPDLGYSAEDVNQTMFPVGAKVQLSSGEHVEIQPWSIKTFGLMSQRIPDTLDKFADMEDKQSISRMLVNLTDEILFMVSETLGITEDKIHETMTFEDLLLVTIAIWDNCIAGPMVKIGGLMGRVVATGAPLTTLKPTKSPTQQPSSSPLST